MNVVIKTEKEIKIMREGGRILAGILKSVVDQVKPEVSTLELDIHARDLCKKNKVKPAFLGYRDYPAVVCVGVNDTVVHGIPSKDEILNEGDIISIDMGIIYKDFYSDHAVTVGVGKISKNAEKLINATSDCLSCAIKQSLPGNTIGDIGYTIQSVAKLAGFSVVRQMVGHGIGRNLHEDPQVPGFGEKGKGLKLKEGMTIAIETIINEGKGEIRFLNDGWTTKTIDGKLSALFEHTVVVKAGGAQILTK
jgi:methionyl aminopeptidase